MVSKGYTGRWKYWEKKGAGLNEWERRDLCECREGAGHTGAKQAALRNHLRLDEVEGVTWKRAFHCVKQKLETGGANVTGPKGASTQSRYWGQREGLILHNPVQILKWVKWEATAELWPQKWHMTNSNSLTMAAVLRMWGRWVEELGGNCKSSGKR